MYPDAACTRTPAPSSTVDKLVAVFAYDTGSDRRVDGCLPAGSIKGGGGCESLKWGAQTAGHVQRAAQLHCAPRAAAENTNFAT